MSLLQMSFSGAVMIFVIIGVRALAIHKLPKKVFLILWEIVLLRLLIPVSIPSAFSAYSLLNNSDSVLETVSEITVVNHMVPQIAAVPSGINAGARQVLGNEAPSVSVWLILWIAGMVICAGYFMIAYLRCQSEFQVSLPVKNEFVNEWLKQQPLKRTVRIRQSGSISAPLTYGVLHPVILMPQNTDWENRQQLRYVLMHESVHIRRFDAAYKLIAALALCIHWYNPFVWIMYILYNRDIELACDERVVRQFGDNSKSIYARTLIAMEETRSGLRPFCNSFSKTAIEERIIAIMETKKITRGLLLISAAMVVVIVVLFATSAKKEESVSDHDTKGIVAEGIEVPDVVLNAAKQITEQKYADMEEGIYSNWKIEALSYVYTYDNIDEMALHVYQLNYEFLADNPDEILLAGGMTIDEDGWVVPEYADSTFLIFKQGNEEMSYLTVLFENDCSPGTDAFTDDLKQKLEIDESEEETRAQTSNIKYMLEGMPEKMPATLYVGDGFSIYIPDKDWIIYDEELEPPVQMSAVLSSEVSVWVERYENKAFSEVEERLLSEGYRYAEDTNKMQKMDGELLIEIRLTEWNQEVWAVYSQYNAAYEWGSRLDAIADTFAVTGNKSHKFS